MHKDKQSKEFQALMADKEASAWIDEHLPGLKKYVSGNVLLYQSLVLAFVLGLIAHVGGYYLLASFPTGFPGLLADLLHALGWSLWTGVVVSVFVQVLPEVKRRQIKASIEAYQALRRKKKTSTKALRSRTRRSR
jgi:hypothetical protein